MAKLLNFHTLSFSGKLGGVVGCKGKHANYLRSLPKKSNKSTLPQQSNRQKMAIISRFLKQIRPLIDISVKLSGRQFKTPYGKLVSYLFHNSCQGEFPDQSLNFSKLIFSYGALALSTVKTIDRGVDGRLQISWESDSSELKGWDDEVVVVLYFPQKDHFRVFRGLARRENLKVTISIPPPLQTEEYLMYMFFLSYNEKDASRTKYLGNSINNFNLSSDDESNL